MVVGKLQRKYQRTVECFISWFGDRTITFGFSTCRTRQMFICGRGLSPPRKRHVLFFPRSSDRDTILTVLALTLLQSTTEQGNENKLCIKAKQSFTTILLAFTSSLSSSSTFSNPPLLFNPSLPQPFPLLPSLFCNHIQTWDLLPTTVTRWPIASTA